MTTTRRNENIIGWVRVRKNGKTGEPFFPVSFRLQDGTEFRAILNLDKSKIRQSMESSEQGKDVVGTIKLDTYKPAMAGTSRRSARPAATPEMTDSEPF